MSTAEKIFREAAGLPDTAQQAVLRIVQLLSAKQSLEDEQWSRFSLESALSGMEDEEWPDFTASPNFETWR